jgi:hypothetical protein
MLDGRYYLSRPWSAYFSLAGTLVQPARIKLYRALMLSPAPPCQPRGVSPARWSRKLGQLVLDGAGNATGVLTVTLNGRVVEGPFAPITGSYSISPGCTGSTSFTSPLTETLGLSLFTNGFFAAGASPLGSGSFTCEFQQLQGQGLGKGRG